MEISEPYPTGPIPLVSSCCHKRRTDSDLKVRRSYHGEPEIAGALKAPWRNQTHIIRFPGISNTATTRRYINVSIITSPASCALSSREPISSLRCAVRLTNGTGVGSRLGEHQHRPCGHLQHALGGEDQPFP